MEAYQEHEIMESALSHFTYRHQLIKALEELAELQVAITKHINYEDQETNVIEELADVHIMLGQLKILFGEDKVNLMIAVKLHRLKKRIGK